MARGRVRFKTLDGAGPAGFKIEDLLVPPAQVAEKVDFAAIFGTDRPVEVEIGSGKGGFLIQAAAQKPEHNFLGIEYIAKYALYVADRAVRRGLTNVRVLSVDAGHLFIHRVPPASVDVLHVYHPDPWPKSGTTSDGSFNRPSSRQPSAPSSPVACGTSKRPPRILPSDNRPDV